MPKEKKKRPQRAFTGKARPALQARIDPDVNTGIVEYAKAQHDGNKSAATEHLLRLGLAVVGVTDA